MIYSQLKINYLITIISLHSFLMEPFLNDIVIRLEQEISTNEMVLFKKDLSEKINDLLINSFASLVQILYRIDIDESQLKAELLQRKEEQASDVIADIMIQRIQNTIATKKQFKQNNSSIIDDSLKW